MMKNKKGVGLFGFGIVVLVGLLIIGIFFVTISPIANRLFGIAEDYVDSPNATAIITNAEAKYDNWLDGAFLFLFGGIWAAGLLIGYYSDYGKVVLAIMIFMLAVLLFAAGGLTDYWEEKGEGDQFASPSEFPNTYFILDNFLLVLLVILGSSIIISVARDY